MSFPFESKSHAYLRRRLLAAMGLLPACATELSVTDAGGHDEDPDAGAAPATPHVDAGHGGDASPLTQDAGGANPVLPGDAGDAGHGGDARPASSDADAPRCEFGRVTMQCFTRTQLEQQAKWGSGGGVMPAMPLRSDAEIQALFLANGCVPRQNAFDSCCNAATSEATIGADGSCCYAFCSGACCGRPFLIQGTARVAPALHRSDWLSDLAESADSALPKALRERAASGWLQDARTEHASVAAFARFTLELLAFGAPADLLIESQRAGLDEIEHARACFALASRYAAAQLGPAALSMAQVAPAASLRESVLSAVIEGCIGETLAAARASAALESARDPATRSVLTKIAEDETRHAELAYRYVAWALTREPTLAGEIGELVARESAGLSSRASTTLPNVQVDAMEPALARLGRLSEARSRATHAATLARVVLPCMAQLLESHAEALQSGGMRGLSSAQVS